MADEYGYSVKDSQEADSDSPDLRKISADIKMPKDNAIVAVYRIVLGRFLKFRNWESRFLKRNIFFYFIKMPK